MTVVWVEITDILEHRSYCINLSCVQGECKVYVTARMRHCSEQVMYYPTHSKDSREEEPSKEMKREVTLQDFPSAVTTS